MLQSQLALHNSVHNSNNNEGTRGRKKEMIAREHKIIRVQHAIPIHNGHRRGVSQSLLYDILCYPGHELPSHIFLMLKNFSITKGTIHGRVYSEAIDVVRGRYFPRPKRLYSM